MSGCHGVHLAGRMEDACGVYLVWLCGVWWAFDGNALHQAGNRESSVHCLHAHTHNESRNSMISLINIHLIYKYIMANIVTFVAFCGPLLHGFCAVVHSSCCLLYCWVLQDVVPGTSVALRDCGKTKLCFFDVVGTFI